MKISKTLEFDMGHRIPNHKSKCKFFHGHRYKIEVIVDDKIITKKGQSNEGMVIDYNDLKKIMTKLIEPYDHSFMMFKEDEFAYVFKKMTKNNIIFVDFIPTAEQIAKHFFNNLELTLKKKKIKLYSVILWETPTSKAEYSYEDN